jgi:sulfur carrier protein ThiS
VTVEVRLFASLRDRLPGAPRGRAAVELAEGASLADLLARLAIPPEHAQMVLVNGATAPRGCAEREALRLAPGDRVAIFPPLAGG